MIHSLKIKNGKRLLEGSTVEYVYHNVIIRFTIRQNDDGTVLSVSYQREPSNRHSLIAIRKSIAQILSINRENVSCLFRAIKVKLLSFIVDGQSGKKASY